MRRVLLALVLSLPCSVFAQNPTTAAAPTTAVVRAKIQQALPGEWVGLLEYRDYSEPATSTKRVQLPTWLTISGDAALTWHYIYDDGPNKVIEETDLTTFDAAASTFSQASNGKPAQVYKVTGLDTLRNGRGVLVLMGNGTDNDKPSEIRITLTVGRNFLLMLQESRSAGSSDPFAFRHVYRFTRAKPPEVVPMAR